MAIQEDKESKALYVDDAIAYAKKLYQEGELIGAFATLSALIEFYMETIHDGIYKTEHPPYEFFENLRTRTHRTPPPSFSCLLEELLKHKICTRQEAAEIKKFGKLRNKAIHGIVRYAYRRWPFNTITRQDAKTGFELGIRLAPLLDSKSNEIYLNIQGKT